MYNGNINQQFTLSQEKITEIIRTHAPDDDKSIDEDSLFIIVKNILNHASQILDNFVKGSDADVELREENPKADFRAPFWTIKSISGALSCKDPAVEIAKTTAVSILEKLSSYKWQAKAVLTLAAFAYDFWEFWHFADIFESNPLAKQFGLLKNVPQLIKTGKLQQQYRQAFQDLNKLIKTIMHVIEIFDKLEKFYNAYDVKDDPELPAGFNDNLPVDVYWTIVTIAAVSTKISILIGDEPEKTLDLKPYDSKINSILSKLEQHLTICTSRRDEKEGVRQIRQLLRTFSEVVQVLKALIFTKDSERTLIIGSTNKRATIDALKGKTVFLYFSTDITNEDIELLTPVYERAKKEVNYEIVWVQVVEQWTDMLRRKFDDLRPKIPWYFVKQFSRTGIRFIKEDWEFTGKPALVVINDLGKFENTKAIDIIKIWGPEAFPFCKLSEKMISDANIPSVLSKITGDPNLNTWMKEGRYIFIYGGKDKELIQQLTEKFSGFKNEPAFKDIVKISIEIFLVGKTAVGGEDSSIVGKFWDDIQSLFAIKVDAFTQDIRKLLSCKNEKAWAVLIKGCTVITAGHGSSMVKVVEEVDKWKAGVKDVSDFEVTIKKYHLEIIKEMHICCEFDVPIATGKDPMDFKCSVCGFDMEIRIKYKCCHNHGPNSHH